VSIADVDGFLPLPPATLHILIALTGGERHGYAVIQDVEARTGGELRLSAGTLYRSVARMLQQGLIAEVTRRRTREDDERRPTIGSRPSALRWPAPRCADCPRS
jgi:hypothetical protein